MRWLMFAASMIVATAASADDPKWTLVWNDEFEGATIDASKWDFDLGNGFWSKAANQWIPGWGNGEREYYTREPENVFLKDGALHIRVLKKSRDGFNYTSARLKSRKADGGVLFAKKYGKIEFRAKLPTGRGVWPALWMMPQDDKYGGWPLSGEIDVMEARGQEPTKVLGTLHYGNPKSHLSHEFSFPSDGSIADWHAYSVEWEPGEIRWGVDGRIYAKQDFWWSASPASGKSKATKTTVRPWPAPFDQRFYIIMNVAVGGNFLGDPDDTTKFPAEMLVDYVRAYDKEGGYGPTKPRGPGALPGRR